MNKPATVFDDVLLERDLSAAFDRAVDEQHRLFEIAEPAPTNDQTATMHQVGTVPFVWRGDVDVVVRMIELALIELQVDRAEPSFDAARGPAKAQRAKCVSPEYSAFET